MTSDSPLYVDNSTLKAVARCSTEAMLRYAWGWTTPEDRAALRAGTAFHALAEAHFKGAPAPEALAAFDAAYREWADANVPAEDRLAHGNLARIVRQWTETHALPALPFTVAPDLVEIGFAYPLTEDGSIVFCGRLDGVARYQDALYVLEHKTTGKLTPDWIDGYSLDSQLSGYLWAAQQHTGKPVVGAFLNAVEFSKLPGGATAGGRAPRKCPDHGVSHAECGHLHAVSKLVIVQRTPAAIAEWHKTAVYLARKYQDMLARWPTIDLAVTTGDGVKRVARVRQQGTFNGSCRFCGFKQWCKLDRPLDYITAGNMVQEPWSPYDRATVEPLPTAHKP